MDCGLLIGNDIIEPEGIVIDVAKRKAILRSCHHMECRLRVTPKKKVTNFAVRCAQTTFVAPNTSHTVPIRCPGLDMHSDYVFRLYLNTTIFPHGSFIVPAIVTAHQTR